MHQQRWKERRTRWPVGPTPGVFLWVYFTHFKCQNRDFIQEEQQRKAEEHLQEAAEIGRTSGISLEKLIELLTLFYTEEA